jgi:hypothetical protein
VEEDTNKDGKPDLWETYDESEALIKREKDLDFDGKPDIVDGEAAEEDKAGQTHQESLLGDGSHV